MSGWTNSELVLCALIKQSDAEATNCRDLSSLKEGALPSLSTFSYEWPKIPSFVRTLNVTQWVAALVQPFKESSCFGNASTRTTAYSTLIGLLKRKALIVDHSMI